MSFGTAGETFIDEVLEEYAIVTGNLVQDIAMDEEKLLLYALLLEMRAQRLNPDANDIEVALDEREDSPTTGASYLSTTESLSERQNTNDAEILDLNFRAQEVDLRFDDDITVAFNDFSSSDNQVDYSASDSPVVGIPVSTGKIWAVAQDGTGGAKLDIEVWSAR